MTETEILKDGGQKRELERGDCKWLVLVIGKSTRNEWEEVASAPRTPAPRAHQGTRLLFMLLRNPRRLLSWP